jgi:hypothetical protein
MKSNFHNKDIGKLMCSLNLENLNQTEIQSNQDLKIESYSIYFPSIKETTQQSTCLESNICKYNEKNDNFFYKYDDTQDYELSSFLLN